MKPYYQDDAVTIYHGDCRDILPSLPKVDLVLTDPPYGVNGGSGTKGTLRSYKHSYLSIPDTPEYVKSEIIPRFCEALDLCQRHDVAVFILGWICSGLFSIWWYGRKRRPR